MGMVTGFGSLSSHRNGPAVSIAKLGFSDTHGKARLQRLGLADILRLDSPRRGREPWKGGAWLPVGSNPAEVRKAARAATRAPEAPTFGAVAEQVLAAKAPAWRSPRHGVHWERSVRTYGGAIWDRPVNAINDAVAREIVLRVWLAIPKTAPRIRGRFETIMDYAKAHGWCTGENPFRLKGNLQPVLPGR